MKTLYYMLFAILSVVVNEDNFIKADDTTQDLEVGDAPYFVTILHNNSPVCNGAILTERFVLTDSDCIIDDLDDYQIVYGTTKFNGDISSNNKKDILRYILVNDNPNDYNDDAPNNDNSTDVNSDTDYDDTRNYVLSEITVVEVDRYNRFNFDRDVNKINIPSPDQAVPSDKGTLVFRSANQSLLSQQYPPGSKHLELDDIKMYSEKLNETQTSFLRGSPLVINNTLYGLLVVAETEEDPHNDYTLLINIPFVINSISAAIVNHS